ncbi:fructose 1,6-bisphosphatase [Limnochorda pilosa]|uniref:Fructose-1,6-bisphosphatase n=1 Tax=Limnochorda pilosa TaxID=1555112 RepID=A0A0K2SQZ8_LIMPI|nr:class II fructose-bisphosphatase [Limnochorda pilosa]BAS29234.1 fructose 1,6-bisphosphatase [Limnochorda pilosa]
MQQLDRNLALELSRVTEAAALAAGRWMGRGDKEAVDRAAVEAMRFALQSVDMDGVVVIGEGEKDRAPMLYIGERVGNGQPPAVDVAVDPIDGTGITASGLNGAISVIALAEQSTLFVTPLAYMEKLVVGPRARGMVRLDAPPAENLEAVAVALDREVRDLTVVVLNRPRNDHLIRHVREAGARIRLIGDGDIAASIQVALGDQGVDVLMGIGGAPEGVITACVLACLGGDMQARLWAKTDEDRALAHAEAIDLDRILTLEDLCRGRDVFVAATGVTDGDLLTGVRYFRDGAVTQSLVMRSMSGTVRWIDARHDLSRLRQLAGGRYDGVAHPVPPPSQRAAHS